MDKYPLLTIAQMNFEPWVNKIGEEITSVITCVKTYEDLWQPCGIETFSFENFDQIKESYPDAIIAFMPVLSTRMPV